MGCLRPKVLVIYSLVLIISSAFSSTKPALNPQPDEVEFELEKNSNCTTIFEGFICWDEKEECPKYVIGSDVETHKKCEKRVRRFRLHEDEEGLTECNPNKDNGVFRKAVSITNIVGSTISAVALILSMIIFLCFESWQKPRISIHFNLFVAFLVHNCCCIVMYSFVVSDAAVLARNEAWCRALNVMSNYFMLSSYTWMLCESLHLHLVISIILGPDTTPFRMFAILGWGVPAVISVLYAASKTYLERSGRCWIERGNSTWILMVPIVITLLASFFYLIKVIHVLIHRTQNVRTSFATRKSARTALLMIPLFGIHFALVPFRPDANTTAEKGYELFLTLVATLQGVCIAAFLCFTNREVVTVLRNGMNRVREAVNMAAVEDEEPNPANFNTMGGLELM